MNATNPDFGGMLSSWRAARGLSQLSLALETEVSQRHISFLESGRATPSRSMVLRLSESLRVPIAHRNAILISAGYAPMFGEEDLASTRLTSARTAMDALLEGVAPAPAFVVDGGWRLKSMNQGAMQFFVHMIGQKRAGKMLSGDSELNVMQMIFDPNLLRPFILDWEVAASGLMQRLHRDASILGPDNPVRSLIAELQLLPGVPAEWRRIVWDRELPPAMTLSFDVRGMLFTFFATVTTIGTPYDIALDDLRLEAFFPADDTTRENMEMLASAQNSKL